MRERADIDDSLVTDEPHGPVPDLPSPAKVDAAVSAFALLADPTRLRLLWLLSTGELDVGSLATSVGATASATSQHLAKLRLAGLVSVRRDGRHHLYLARGGHVRNLIAEALYQADHQVSGHPDHE